MTTKTAAMRLRIDDLERQVDSLKEALRGAYDREPGPIGLKKALAREGYEIASEADGVVVIRETERGADNV